ncbi:SRPBCC family protein [Bdellovibrio bacteriovorus]|uniref:SRPBCC family protein n=1 Tax=Bdellovibrio bacteriovorus TaxID=959 RepID=UPI000A7C9BBB|nr:SRPBCC family protein [Bdellovibrio bacteriovorus]
MRLFKTAITILLTTFCVSAFGKSTKSAKDKMTTTLPAKHISITINRPSDEVYQFASNPENLPQWAAGLADATLRKSGNEWITNSPMGQVKVKFVDKNPYGVIDHDVELPSGEVVNNPLRVIKNASGSEVIFTLFRRPNMTEEMFAKDAELVTKDLKKLKSILEK